MRGPDCSLNINAMFNTGWGKRQSIGKKIHRSVSKDKNSVLGSPCSQRTGQDWKQKRPPGILGKYSTIRHSIKAEKTFQQRWNFNSLGTRRLAWVILKWSCPLNCKESFLKKGCSVNEAKAGKQGDCPSHLLMSNMLSHESGQFVWFGSLTESPVHLAWWAQHQALGWSKGIAAFCVFNSLSSKQFFLKGFYWRAISKQIMQNLNNTQNGGEGRTHTRHSPNYLSLHKIQPPQVSHLLFKRKASKASWF